MIPFYCAFRLRRLARAHPSISFLFTCHLTLILCTPHSYPPLMCGSTHVFANCSTISIIISSQNPRLIPIFVHSGLSARNIDTWDSSAWEYLLTKRKLQYLNKNWNCRRWTNLWFSPRPCNFYFHSFYGYALAAAEMCLYSTNYVF